MVPGGVSIRRSTDPATDGLTDDRMRHGGDNSKRRRPAIEIGGSELLGLRKR
jgi:hypothetical protein